MGFFETLNWVRNNGPVTEYGPQAQFQDYSLRKHNGATPGRIRIEYFNGDRMQTIDEHVADHDITEDQFGNIQYIQLLHDDNHIQIVRAASFNVEFWCDRY